VKNLGWTDALHFSIRKPQMSHVAYRITLKRNNIHCILKTTTGKFLASLMTLQAVVLEKLKCEKSTTFRWTDRLNWRTPNTL